jgi:hypothetical protein
MKVLPLSQYPRLEFTDLALCVPRCQKVASCRQAASY